MSDLCCLVLYESDNKYGVVSTKHIFDYQTNELVPQSQIETNNKYKAYFRDLSKPNVKPNMIKYPCEVIAIDNLQKCNSLLDKITKKYETDNSLKGTVAKTSKKNKIIIDNNINNSSLNEAETSEVIAAKEKKIKSTNKSKKISDDAKSNEINSEMLFLKEQNDILKKKLADSHDISIELNKLKISNIKLKEENEQLKSDRRDDISKDCSSENLMAIACNIFNRIGKISDLNKLYLYKEIQKTSKNTDKNQEDQTEFEEEMVPYTDNPNFSMYTLPISSKYLFEKYSELKKDDKLIYKDSMLIRKILNSAMTNDEWKSHTLDSVMKNKGKLFNAIKLFVQTLRPKIDDGTWKKSIRTKINDSKKDLSIKTKKRKKNDKDSSFSSNEMSSAQLCSSNKQNEDQESESNQCGDDDYDDDGDANPEIIDKSPNESDKSSNESDKSSNESDNSSNESDDSNDKNQTNNSVISIDKSLTKKTFKHSNHSDNNFQDLNQSRLNQQLIYQQQSNQQQIYQQQFIQPQSIQQHVYQQQSIPPQLNQQQVYQQQTIPPQLNQQQLQQQHLYQSQTNHRHHLSTIELNFPVVRNQQESHQPMYLNQSQQQSSFYNNQSEPPIYSELKSKQKRSQVNDELENKKKFTTASKKNENENENDKIYRADSFLN